MDLVDPEHGGKAKRAEIVVFRLAVPDDEIVENVSDFLQPAGKVAVKGIEVVLLPQVHYDDAAVAPGFKT